MIKEEEVIPDWMKFLIAFSGIVLLATLWFCFGVAKIGWK